MPIKGPSNPAYTSTLVQSRALISLKNQTSPDEDPNPPTRFNRIWARRAGPSQPGAATGTDAVLSGPNEISPLLGFQ